MHEVAALAFVSGGDGAWLVFDTVTLWIHWVVAIIYREVIKSGVRDGSGLE